MGTKSNTLKKFYSVVVVSMTIIFFQNCSENSFSPQEKKAQSSTERNNSNDREEQYFTITETVTQTEIETKIVETGCAPGLKPSKGIFDTGCDGEYTCWKKKDASGGTHHSATDGVLVGWPKYFVQCERQYAQLPALCPEGSEIYSGTSGLPCSSPNTCWRKRAQGSVTGLVDGSAYGWDDWYVQCQNGSPQL